MNDITTNPDIITDDQNPEQPRRWRDVLPIHPAAELFPLMSADELQELAADIKKHGLREKIDIYEDPELGLCLLDGRNRADALELIGEEVVTVTGYPSPCIWNHIYAKKSFDPVAYVVSRNLHRRHLTSEQKRDVIAKLLARDPTKSNRAIAAITGRSHVTVAAVREEMEATGQIDQLAKTTGRDGKARPAKRRGLWDFIHREPSDEGPEPVEQWEPERHGTEAIAHDPALDEATVEEMHADPASYWQELTNEANKRLREAFHAAREARNREDHTAVVHALGDLIAAATEIKGVHEGLLPPGQGLQ